MYQGQAVAVVVPAYNEQSLVGRTIASLPDFVDHVILVDDGSADRTSERGALASLGRPGFSLVAHTENRGVGAAILTGYRRALQLRTDIVVVVGADAQMDPTDMSALLDALRRDGAQYAKGDRLSYPGVCRVMPGVRLFGNIALSLLTRISSGYWCLRDSQCGYTAIRREALHLLDLSAVYPRYGYPNDLLAHLNAAGATITEVPVRPIYAQERSGIRVLRVVAPLLLLLLRSCARRLWRKHGLPRPRLRPTAEEVA